MKSFKKTFIKSPHYTVAKSSLYLASKNSHFTLIKSLIKSLLYSFRYRMITLVKDLRFLRICLNSWKNRKEKISAHFNHCSVYPRFLQTWPDSSLQSAWVLTRVYYTWPSSILYLTKYLMITLVLFAFL